jgi:hypothetical protein
MGFEHMVNMLKRYGAKSESEDIVYELIHVVKDRVYIGPEDLKTPEENPFLLNSAISAETRRSSVTPSTLLYF